LSTDFNSEEEMFAELKNVIEMSGEERLQWETKNGFYDPEVHFQSIDCWTTIPQLTLPVSLMCNTPVPE